MPQDWVSHALWNKRPFPTSKHRVNGHGGLPTTMMPPEALAFLTVTDCEAFRPA
jgi:hypothetical protein